MRRLSCGDQDYLRKKCNTSQTNRMPQIKVIDLETPHIK